MLFLLLVSCVAFADPPVEVDTVVDIEDRLESAEQKLDDEIAAVAALLEQLKTGTVEAVVETDTDADNDTDADADADSVDDDTDTDGDTDGDEVPIRTVDPE